MQNREPNDFGQPQTAIAKARLGMNMWLILAV
jgi:hypothetical protein